MAAKRVTVAYILEDVAHEAFIPALVQRVARELTPQVSVRARVISAYGGSHALTNFRRFLRDARIAESIAADLVVIGMDSDTLSAAEKRRALEAEVRKAPALRTVVYHECARVPLALRQGGAWRIARRRPAPHPWRGGSPCARPCL